MGTDDYTPEEFMFCADGKPIGTLPDLISIEAPVVTAHERAEDVCVDFPEAEITIKAKFSFWYHRCRSRRRFIKLMSGCFGVQRNEAKALAKLGLEVGVPSYQDMWNAACLFFQDKLLGIKFSIGRPVITVTEAPAGASE